MKTLDHATNFVLALKDFSDAAEIYKRNPSSTSLDTVNATALAVGATASVVQTRWRHRYPAV
jgi:6-phosphogluconolactonase (cycloisomerase 2 family)